MGKAVARGNRSLIKTWQGVSGFPLGLYTVLFILAPASCLIPSGEKCLMYLYKCKFIYVQYKFILDTSHHMVAMVAGIEPVACVDSFVFPLDRLDLNDDIYQGVVHPISKRAPV